MLEVICLHMLNLFKKIEPIELNCRSELPNKAVNNSWVIWYLHVPAWMLIATYNLEKSDLSDLAISH